MKRTTDRASVRIHAAISVKGLQPPPTLSINNTTLMPTFRHCLTAADSRSPFSTQRTQKLDANCLRSCLTSLRSSRRYRNYVTSSVEELNDQEINSSSEEQYREKYTNIQFLSYLFLARDIELGKIKRSCAYAAHRIQNSPAALKFACAPN